MQFTWTDRTDYRNAPLYRSACHWDVTAGNATYQVDRTAGAYHLSSADGLDWFGKYVTPADVEAAIAGLAAADAPADEPEPESATDDDIVRAFDVKAIQIAKANGWTIGHAKAVMLRYLRDTTPVEAATIAAALQTRAQQAA